MIIIAHSFVMTHWRRGWGSLTCEGKADLVAVSAEVLDIDLGGEGQRHTRGNLGGVAEAELEVLVE